MAELRTATRGRLRPRDLVGELLDREFPSLDLTLGEAVEDLSSGQCRAVALTAEAVPGGLPGIDHFLFPGDTSATGAALIFHAGDPLLQAVRRHLLPPVILAGAGPGGVGTMTVDARRAVSRADVVLADGLCGTEVLEGMRADAAHVPVGKRCGHPSKTQVEINRRLADEARNGLRVVRLKGGDPSVFGRLDEEVSILRDLGLSYRVLPGVGAASAAAALIGQPLTARGASAEIVFSTGRLAGGGKNPFPLGKTTVPSIALYMSRRVLDERVADLTKAGYPPSTPVVVVEKIGSPEARAVAGRMDSIVRDVDRDRVGTPAVVLVGPHLHAPDHLPLSGLRIWLPAERETAATHRLELEELGATCVMQPLIEPIPLEVDAGPIFARPFDWVLFTSKKSVDYFFDLLSDWGLDSRWLPRVAAIGSPTIEKLRARGIEPDLIPPEPTRVALSTSLVEIGLCGKRVLIPASAVAPDHVRFALAPHAAEVVRLNLYSLRFPTVETVPDADVVLFSSESTVRSARQNGLLDEIRRRGMVTGGVGAATRCRLEEENLSPSIVPDGFRPADLARATRRYFANLGIAALLAEGR